MKKSLASLILLSAASGWAAPTPQVPPSATVTLSTAYSDGVPMPASAVIRTTLYCLADTGPIVRDAQGEITSIFAISFQLPAPLPNTLVSTGPIPIDRPRRCVATLTARVPLSGGIFDERESNYSAVDFVYAPGKYPTPPVRLQ